MSWNYRVLRRVEGGEVVYAIHEVYYDENGKANGWTAGPTWPEGETLRALAEDGRYYTDAYLKPVLIVCADDSLREEGVLPSRDHGTGKHTA